MGPTPDTVIIGAGQAGVTTSYLLTQLGVEHQILERRDSLGGAFQDRWDSFYMNTPNLSLDLPGMQFDGGDRDVFISRDAVVNLFRRYAELRLEQELIGWEWATKDFGASAIPGAVQIPYTRLRR